jgi:hypothetical protein
MEQINTADVDDKDVLEGLFKENKEILQFLSSGLEKNGKNQTPTRSQEKLGEISEEKDNDDETGKHKGSFPLIAKANSQACWENFHPITIFESTRRELATVSFCGEWKRGF